MVLILRRYRERLSEVKRLRETMKFSSLGPVLGLTTPAVLSPPLSLPVTSFPWPNDGVRIQTLPPHILQVRTFIASRGTAELQTLCSKAHSVPIGHGGTAEVLRVHPQPGLEKPTVYTAAKKTDESEVQS